VPSHLDFFSLPFPSPDLSFFCNFIFYPPATQFFFFLAFETFPTHLLPPTVPTDLLTYIFKLKVDSSPHTYSPLNLKCATFIPTHLPTPHLFIYLPTL
jgi:hypothetical protein